MIGVLVSGEGTNLQALIDDGLPIAGVISSRAGARALERAASPRASRPRSSPLEDFETREERDAAMADWFERARRRARCLRGLHVAAPPAVPRPLRRPDREHALGAAARFPGAHPIEDVLAAGVPETAATVHYVDEGIDTGPVIAAEKVPVHEGDTAETLRARVQAAEHRLLPKVVRELCER